ncbi:MAG: Trehalose utilization [Fibrobacteres bacterium]|nr:Trehalose utilization [Fibrobacterota bacterium]
MKLRARLPIAGAMLAGFLMAGCGDGPSAGTDAGNADKVAGILTDTSGLAVAGRLIQMRPADFQGSLADSLLGHSSPGMEWSDTTGPDGGFAFFPGPADTGDFVVEALVNEVKGARANFRREPKQSVRLGDLVLRAIGGITGKVSLPPSAFGGMVVTLLGTHLSEYIPPGAAPAGTGAFGFYSLPPGEYQVRVEGIHPVRKAVDTLIEVLPGKTVTDLSLTAGPALDTSAGALSLRLAFPGPLAGRLKARLEEGGGILTADSGGAVLFQDVTAGSHTVLAWGENPFRDTLRLAGISVKPGLTTAAGEIRFKIKALIVDGIANHDWKRMTLYHSAILKASGIFDVAVSTTPPDQSGPQAWAAWNPQFSENDVVILHCNSGYTVNDSANPWPDSIKARLEAFVASGGGLVNTHATFPGFSGWPAFDEMRGLMWKATQPAGSSYRLDSLDALVADPATLDSGSIENAAPGNPGERMGIANPDHPLNRGLPAQWLLPPSELLYHLKGSPQGVTVLEYSVNPFTGSREPQQWVKQFGKGRVFTSTVGHLYPGTANTAYRCAGYQTTFSRGAEWAASGTVTLPVPGDFPGKDSISLRDNLP